MPSLIPGFEYDIFISYRQKDNKYDGWVTEFVDHLKRELESTFKEDISVYFDINPTDGLLETYDIDASLKEKLKCFVFIPILSRTYCDPKSFSWEHEFKAFVEQASHDQFGLKVKLSSGNVSSRVLPVRINDLDQKDIELYESVLGGVLRGIDFIYAEPGVNRPLRSNEENPHDNQNHTIYRNQINKVSNAIKEIITAIEYHELKPEEVTAKIYEQVSVPKRSKKTAIIAGSVTILAMIILSFLFIPKLVGPKERLEKSIAVLPFRNESPVDSNKYFIDGIMEEVLLNLQAIEDLRVLSRTSAEKYRNTSKSILEIARELGVNYIIEGSGQKVGNNFRLRVQLIKATGKEDHLWAKSYGQEIAHTKEIFDIQNQIAQTIATELKVFISPEEKQIIEKSPTASLTAYDFYQRGNNEYRKYSSSDTSTRGALNNAKKMYNIALNYDPEFALAYVGLANVYWDKHYWEEYLSENFLDSVRVLANNAIKFDNKLSEAYTLRGRYYAARGFTEHAVRNFDEAIKYNPNDYAAYSQKGLLVRYYEDYIIGIKCLENAVILDRGENLPSRLEDLAYYYCDIGFADKAKYYFKEALALHGDSAKFLGSLAWIKFSSENFEEALNLAKRALEIDTARRIAMEYYYFLPSKYDEEAYLNAKKISEVYKKTGQLPLLYSYRIGYAFWKAGKKDEAQYFFNQQIKYDEESLKLGRSMVEWGATYYNLACTYAFLGEKEKAYRYLDEWNKKKVYPLWWVVFLKHEPFFDSLRNEKRFQKILNNIEVKYQAEHERVRKWLEENNML